MPRSTLKSLRGCWKSIALAEWGSISAEAEGKWLCRSLIGSALDKWQFVVDMALLWSYIQSCFWGHFINILFLVTGKACSQFWRRLLLIVTQCAISGLGLHSQRSLQTCLLVMVQESIPSCCIFQYLELHYYNNWSHIKLYIWSTASSLVIIIFIGGSIIHLVIQETIILWNKQNTNGIVNSINGSKSKYFSQELPTPVYFKDRQD